MRVLVTDPEEVAAIKALPKHGGQRNATPISSATAKALGMRIRSRQATRDGVNGAYWWLEPRA
jgi:hypothetical protein